MMKPNMLTSLVVLLSVSSSLAIFLPPAVVAAADRRRLVKRCGVRNPPLLIRRANEARLEHRRERHRELNVKPSCEELCSQCISIDVVFHLLALDVGYSVGFILPHPTAATEAALVGSEVAREDFTTVSGLIPTLNDQIAYVNNAYKDTPFFFEDVTRNSPMVHQPTNYNWTLAASDFSKDISQAYNVGDDRTLNVYLVYNAGSVSDPEGQVTFGFATFPSEQLGDKGDGVFMRFDTLPGGGAEKTDLGETLVHEIGHWLGLYHVFQETSGTTFVEEEVDRCDPANAGDFVSDTPPMATDTASYISQLSDECSCPITCLDFLVDPSLIPDTCSNGDDVDPVFNYMNYVDDDACFEAAGYFTCGQVERMFMHYKLFREHISGCANGIKEVEIEIVVLSDSDEALDDDVGDVQFFLNQRKADKTVTNLLNSSSDSMNDFYFLSSKNSLVVDLCVPRQDTYEFLVKDKPGNPAGTVLFEVWTDGKLAKQIKHDKDSPHKQMVTIVPSPTKKPKTTKKAYPKGKKHKSQ